MQVETYEIEEINSSEASTMAADAEALELVEKLGLKGQQKLSQPETGTRFPYPRLSAAQEAVYGTMFPQRTPLVDYDQGIIPLRVLQVAAYCKEMPQTATLMVWHTESVKEDPILVGSPGPYSTERYLLARWGDSLISFDELKEKAVSKAEAMLNLELSSAKAKFDQMLSNLPQLARVFVETGKRPNYWIHE